jgi:molybdopterin/thiamine biosynthesis adenylyltransferase
MTHSTFDLSGFQHAEDRYDRQKRIQWWNQDRLDRAHVMVIGAGALGNEAIKLLALVGVGHLLVVDFDTIETSNLSRSVLFRETDIGRRKVDAAVERARELNPDIQIQGFHGDVEFDLGEGAFHGCDCVLGCLDNMHARLIVNRACQRAGIPFVHGGIGDVSGEVALFVPGMGACFECLMTAGAWKHEMQRYSCGGLRNAAPERHTPTTATIAGLIATLMVNETLYGLHHSERLADKPGLKPGQRLFVSLESYALQVMDLPEDPECLAHDSPTPPIWVPDPDRELTGATLATHPSLAAAKLGTDPEIVLPFEWLISLQCAECGAEETIHQPLARIGVEKDICPHCHTPGREKNLVDRFHVDSDHGHTPLAQLGVLVGGIVALRGNGKTVTVALGSSEALWGPA